MGNRQAEQFNAKLEREIKHMLNGGATRETTIRYVVARLIREESTFSSRQLCQIFEMVL